MRLQSTNERKRRWEHLQEATGESTTSGATEELLRAAEERESLTGEGIGEK